MTAPQNEGMKEFEKIIKPYLQTQNRKRREKLKVSFFSVSTSFMQNDVLKKELKINKLIKKLEFL